MNPFVFLQCIFFVKRYENIINQKNTIPVWEVRDVLRRIEESVVMFLTGGIIYFYFEILVRGYSHLSMFVLGGICFFLVGRLGNAVLLGSGNLLLKLIKIMALSGVLITFLELLTGLLVNVVMGLKVWDYSQMKYNFMGQVCLLYSLIWSLLGLPCVYFYGIIKNFIMVDVAGNA